MNTQVADDKEFNEEENGIEQYRRANPERAIYITGEINQDLVDRVQPQILKYRHESNEPITVYINSHGGSIPAAQFIHGLLKRPDQKGNNCHIITVATGFAESAAANLLALGNYAMAYPDAIIYYHGSRLQSYDLNRDVTTEYAAYLANRIGSLNEQSATNIADSIMVRYLYKYLYLHDLPQFQQAKENIPGDACKSFLFVTSSKSLFDVCAFSFFLSKQLSAPLDKLAFNDALEQLSDLAYVQQLKNESLLEPVITAWNNLISQKNFSKNQVEHLKSDMSVFQALLERRLNLMSDSKSGVDNLFNEDGWMALYDEFNYVTECLRGRYSQKALKILIENQQVLLSSEEIQKYNEFDSDDDQRCYLNDIAKQKLELLWLYAVTICRLLQKGEYPLSVEDAYWLGLINEIVGQNIISIKE